MLGVEDMMLLQEDDELANMESIAVHLRELIEADSISVSDTENYSKDLDIIGKKIHDMKVEKVMNSLPQIESSYTNDKCANCGDGEKDHNGDEGECKAFGTCICRKFVPFTLDSMEVPFNPRDIEN